MLFRYFFSVDITVKVPESAELENLSGNGMIVPYHRRGVVVAVAIAIAVI